MLLDECTRAPYPSYDESAPQYKTMISMPERKLQAPPILFTHHSLCIVYAGFEDGFASAAY
jgi:hypothetical protein